MQKQKQKQNKKTHTQGPGISLFPTKNFKRIQTFTLSGKKTGSGKQVIAKSSESQELYLFDTSSKFRRNTSKIN